MSSFSCVVWKGGMFRVSVKLCWWTYVYFHVLSCVLVMGKMFRFSEVILKDLLKFMRLSNWSLSFPF